MFFRSTFISLLWLVIAVQALPIERKRDIYLTLPSQSKSTATQDGKSSFYTLDGAANEGQLSSSSGYIASPTVITSSPTVQDPKAVWTVPMIPSGQFSPMPNIVHHVISTIAIPQSSANEPKKEEGKSVEAKPEEAKKEGEPKSEEAKKEGEPKPEEAKKEGEPKPEEAKKEGEPKPEEAKKEGESKPEEPKPEEPKPEEPKTEEPKPEPKPAEPPKARRSLNVNRNLQLKQMVKRQEGGGLSDKCTVEQQYIVPVTYTELQGLNEGTLKLQRLGSEESKTESTPTQCGENADVIVAPVSDEQMAQIQAGTLQIVQLDQPGQVSLEPVEETTSGSVAGGGEEEQGPMYDVIPTNDSLTDQEVQDAVKDFTAGKNLLDQQYESEAEDVKNITGTLKSKGKSLLGQDQDIHITLRRRDHMIYVERKQDLTKRVEGVYR